jgi:hypothetical protein
MVTTDTGQGKLSLAADTGANGSFNFCIVEVRTQAGKKRAWFVCGSDVFANVLRFLWNLPIAWSGRQRTGTARKGTWSQEIGRHLLRDPAVTTSPNTTGRCRIAPNEKEISHGRVS